MIYVRRDIDGDVFVVQNADEGKGDFLITTCSNLQYHVSTNETHTRGLILAIKAVSSLTLLPIISAEIVKED